MVERPPVFGAHDVAGLAEVLPFPVGLAFVGEDDVRSRLHDDAVHLGYVVERGDGARESGERGVVGGGWGRPGWLRGVGAEPAEHAVEAATFRMYREDDRFGVVAGGGEATQGGGDHVGVAEGPFQDERIPV